MNNINKQLETILSKLSNISTFTSSAFLDAWWEDNADKAKIEDVIDISGATGVLQNDMVDSVNIVDESITYDKLNSEGLDWNVINSNPTGSDTSSDLHQTAPRVFTARGGGFIPLHNSVADVVKSLPIVDGTYYTMLGAGASGLQSDGIIVPIDMLYDNTNKVLRYQTLRFDFLLMIANEIGAGGATATTKIKLNLFSDYAGDGMIDDDFDSISLVLPLTSAYYDAGCSIKAKDISLGEDFQEYSYLWVAGEIDINQGDFITTNLEKWWANISSLDDSSVETVTNPVSNISICRLPNLNGNILLLPEISLTGTNIASGIASMHIFRQSYMLVNKKLENSGWAISKRYRYVSGV